MKRSLFLCKYYIFFIFHSFAPSFSVHGNPYTPGPISDFYSHNSSLFVLFIMCILLLLLISYFIDMFILKLTVDLSKVLNNNETQKNRLVYPLLTNYIKLKPIANITYILNTYIVFISSKKKYIYIYYIYIYIYPKGLNSTNFVIKRINKTI